MLSINISVNAVVHCMLGKHLYMFMLVYICTESSYVCKESSYVCKESTRIFAEVI